MGIFGWIGCKTNAVTSQASDEVEKTDETNNSWFERFTGQATFEEADKLYEDIKMRFEQHKAYFEKEVDNLTSQIEDLVESINESKKTIKKVLFPAFADKMHRLKDIPVSDDYIEEHYAVAALKIDSIKEKADLYQIDFNKDSFKANAYAIVTLGFYTRKKAENTLEEVKEEKDRLEKEIDKMDKKLGTLRQIKDTLALIADMYLSLISIYRVLLNRLDNSVNFLMIRCIGFVYRLVQEKMSIKLLPASQQKEIMAMCTISSILKEMVSRKITIDGQTKKICEEVRATKEKIETIMNAA